MIDHGAIVLEFPEGRRDRAIIESQIADAAQLPTVDLETAVVKAYSAVDGRLAQLLVPNTDNDVQNRNREVNAAYLSLSLQESAHTVTPMKSARAKDPMMQEMLKVSRYPLVLQRSLSHESRAMAFRIGILPETVAEHRSQLEFGFSKTGSIPENLGVMAIQYTMIKGLTEATVRTAGLHGRFNTTNSGFVEWGQQLGQLYRAKPLNVLRSYNTTRLREYYNDYIRPLRVSGAISWAALNQSVERPLRRSLGQAVRSIELLHGADVLHAGSEGELPNVFSTAGFAPMSPGVLQAHFDAIDAPALIDVTDL